MSVKTKKLKAPDGTDVPYNVLACDNAQGCPNEASAETQHSAGWLTVLEYYLGGPNADIYSMVETNYCSRTCLAKMPAKLKKAEREKMMR
jgi:hypothetical protein